MNVTLDGFMSGPDCELDWHFEAWSADMARELSAQLQATDTILLGRITYQAMAHYWPSRSQDLSFPREDLAFAEMMNKHRKIVFSKTLDEASWNNTIVCRGSVIAKIRELKQQPGRDIIVYGSGQLVNKLMADNLIDVYTLWLHPVAIGKGKPLFKKLRRRISVSAQSVTQFSSGVLALSYHSR